MQNLSLVVHTPARIIVNERTGTIVLGGDVKLTPVSVIHGNLSIEVSTTYTVAPVPGAYPPGWYGPGMPPPDGPVPTAQPLRDSRVMVRATWPRHTTRDPTADPDRAGRNQADPDRAARDSTAGTPAAAAALVPQTTLTVNDAPAQSMRLDDGANVEELVNGLHAIGTTARDVVAILQAIKAEGGIQAELEVQ